jgi:limonene-1,2-epoxide hydrolase
MTNLERTRAFCAAFDRRDLDAIAAAVTEDCVYHNIPMEPVVGRAAVSASLAGFVNGASRIEWLIHAIAEAADGTVLTERTDRFEIGGKWISVRVMGTFEFRDGLISAWRDYFDLAEFTKQMQPG